MTNTGFSDLARVFAGLLSRSVSKQILKMKIFNVMHLNVGKCRQMCSFGSFLSLTWLSHNQKSLVLGLNLPLISITVLRNLGSPIFFWGGGGGGAQIPVKSQLNVSAWEVMLENYWDQQLIELRCHGFLLDFNRKSVLISEMRNHASALQFRRGIEACLSEECSYDTILGPFTENPIAGCHYSPFMTREKTDLMSEE